MNYNVSIVIVNYNGKKYLKNLFDSLENIQFPDKTYQIVFVDNNSIDGSVSFLKENFSHFDNIVFVNNKKNEGFANGNNIGVAHATGRYVVLLNNDTKVERDWLQNLYNCIRQTNAGIVTSKLIFFNDFLTVRTSTQDKFSISSRIKVNGVEYEIQPKFCKNLLHYGDKLICFGHSIFFIPINNPAKTIDIEFEALETHNICSDKLTISSIDFNFIDENNRLCLRASIDVEIANLVRIIQNAGSDLNEHYNGYDIGFGEVDTGQFQVECERNLACGAAMIIERDIFLKIGGFEKSFFAYYEDTDLSLRVRTQGKKIIYCPSAVVRHVHTGTSKEWSPFFIFLITRNRLWFILRNFSLCVFTRQFTSQLIYTIKGFTVAKSERKRSIIELKAIVLCLIKAPFLLKRRKQFK
jgi:GT2 family glycosyltransferase